MAFRSARRFVMRRLARVVGQPVTLGPGPSPQLEVVANGIANLVCANGVQVVAGT